MTNYFICMTNYYTKIIIFSQFSSNIDKQRLIIFEMPTNFSPYTRKLLTGITSVLVSTIALSYQIQKLLNVKYKSIHNNKSDYFVYPSLVTWLGCLFCAIYGSIYAAFYETKVNKIALKQRIRLGLLFTLNYLPTNYALLYISYPLQVITKNTRYLLVVIVGVFFSRVPKNRTLKLPLSKIYIAILITFGAGLFMFFESKGKSKENHFHPQKKWIGFALLLLAIVFDAFFSDSQAYCKAIFKPTQNQLFLASNLYGFVFIFGFALLNGQIYPSLAFCLSHPSAIKDIFTIASLQIISQVSIYYVISNFKQHIYPLISTVRKILTILLSIFAFDHKVKSMQWVGIVIVFLAMGYQLYDQIMSQQHHRKVRMSRSKIVQIKNSPSNKPQASKQKQYRQDQNRKNNLMSRYKGKNGRQQSYSKYGYQWRRKEIAQTVQPSQSQQAMQL